MPGAEWLERIQGHTRASSPFGQGRGLRKVRAEVDRAPRGRDVFVRSLLGSVSGSGAAAVPKGTVVGRWIGSRETPLNSVLFPLGALSPPQAPAGRPWRGQEQGDPCVSCTLDERLDGHLLRPTAFQYCSISQRRKLSFWMEVESGCARASQPGSHVRQ